jgi:rubrerythrin
MAQQALQPLTREEADNLTAPRLDRDWRVKQMWTIEELPWDQLDPSKVDADLLSIIKAAALVEYNAVVYAKYLNQVFPDDPKVQEDINDWAKEEVVHGTALGTWAQRIDPSWDFEAAMARFRAGYQPEHFINDVNSSVRGSRSGEMVARCMVEVGTSSFYTSIRNATNEPVLKQIAKNIAGDEFRHYKCFYDIMNKYLEQDGLTVLGRLKVAVGRISESEDDELAYAYYAANAAANDNYNREAYSRAYLMRASTYYKQQEIDKAVSMIFKACGLKPQSLAYKVAAKIAWWKFNSEARRMQKVAA